jgi:TetR/AcrR family transcriptional regulator, regulator of biofilm formation and stress response
MSRVSTEDRRRQLIDAAVSLLLEQGPPALTARAIAARAGAPVGTVHYAFRDMDELLGLAALEVLASAWVAIGEIRTDQGVRAVVEDILTGFAASLRDNPQNGLAFFEIYVSTFRSGAGAQTVTDAHAHTVDLLTAAEQHDQAPSRIPLRQLAHLIMFAVDGLALIHFGRSDQAQTPADADAMIKALQALV